MSAHITFYKKTGGRLGNRALKHRFLLLNTVGRKTGQMQTTPLSYFTENGRYILVASNWGRTNHPQWFLNLLQQPHASVEIGPVQIPVTMTQSAGEEYDQLWEQVSRGNRH